MISCLPGAQPLVDGLRPPAGSHLARTIGCVRMAAGRAAAARSGAARRRQPEGTAKPAAWRKPLPHRRSPGARSRERSGSAAQAGTSSWRPLLRCARGRTGSGGEIAGMRTRNLESNTNRTRFRPLLRPPRASTRAPCAVPLHFSSCFCGCIDVRGASKPHCRQRPSDAARGGTMAALLSAARRSAGSDCGRRVSLRRCAARGGLPRLRIRRTRCSAGGGEVDGTAAVCAS